MQWSNTKFNFQIGKAHPPQEWKRGSYGQNVAWGYEDVQDALKRWFEEYIVCMEIQNINV